MLVGAARRAGHALRVRSSCCCAQSFGRWQWRAVISSGGGQRELSGVVAGGGGGGSGGATAHTLGEQEAEALLVHWCAGLRSVLDASALPMAPIDHGPALAALAALRESPPHEAAAAGVGGEAFWASLYLSVALETEVLLAAGAPPSVGLELGRLASACAEAGAWGGRRGGVATMWLLRTSRARVAAALDGIEGRHCGALCTVTGTTANGILRPSESGNRGRW
jgi:hypothetical protein